MTEMVYEAPMTSFVPAMKPDPVTTVPILAEGRKALEHINSEWGLGMDDDPNQHARPTIVPVNTVSGGAS